MDIIGYNIEKNDSKKTNTQNQIPISKVATDAFIPSPKTVSYPKRIDKKMDLSRIRRTMT